MNNQVIRNVIIPSVNFHLWEPCNMKCSFCFATFQDVKKCILPKGHLPKEEALEIVKQLAKSGFKKITFAGGEPTLCQWLSELIKYAKELGLVTMIISNGTKITNDFLEQNKDYLDWIGISIDSLDENTNIKIGRAISGHKTLSQEYYYSLINKIKAYGYKLKLNTVINKYNNKEKFVEFIEYANPERWKVMQVLPIEGQNDGKVDDLLINDKEFKSFITNHKHIASMVAEENKQMIASYVMIDPSGRFFDNVSGKHRYSLPILEVGVEKAYSSMEYNFEKFVERGGVYNTIKGEEKTI